MANTFILPTNIWGYFEEGYKLDNGLKVILINQPENPVVSMRVLIKAGSADEIEKSEYGLAHLMEHMAFKGTPKRKVGEISKIIENNGGYMNAYTSNSETVYYIDLPADKAELGIDILSDMVFNPLYDPKEYANEKEVVIEEIKRGQDNPDRQLVETFFEMSYKNHPYGRSVIGLEETVRGASVEKAKSFHHKFYRPDNAILVISGGFNAVDIKNEVNKYFGSLKNPGKKLADKTFPALQEQTAPTVVIKTNEQAAVAKVIMGFRGPSFNQPNAKIMDLLSAVLSQGNSSRLIESIKNEKLLVSDISSYSYTPEVEGSFMIDFESDPSNVIPAIQAVLKELEHLQTNPPSDEELARAKALTEKDFIQGQQSAGGIGSQAMNFEKLAGDWRLKDAYITQWSRINSKTLQMSAAKIFKPENLTLVVMLPASAPNVDELAKEVPALVNNFALNVDEKKLASLTDSDKLDFETYKLKSGATLLIKKNSQLPLVSIKVGFLGGLIVENKENSGINNFMVKVWPKASTNLNSRLMSRAVEDLGATIEGFSGYNSIGLNASILSSNLDKGFDLFLDTLLFPSFDKANVEEVRPEILADIKRQNERLASKTFRLLATEIYGDHPYALNILGTEKNISSFTENDLKNLYQKLVTPENMVIVVNGDVDIEKIKNLLDKKIINNSQIKSEKPTLPPAPKKIEKDLKVAEKIDSAQVHIALGFLAAPLNSSDQAALEVLDSYLSGMGGPLFSDLRDKQSLAYTVTSSYNPNPSTGSFSFYIATDPKKADKALQEIYKVINEVKNNNIAAEDLEGAKTYLKGSMKISRQSLASQSGQALFNNLYGLGDDFDERHMEAIDKVTNEDIKRVAIKYLDLEHCALASIGNWESATKN